jgi:ABC-2 type transport system permease protein
MLARRQLRPGFWLVFWREIGWLRRRPLLFAFITIVPMGLMACSPACSAPVLRRLPIAVLDLDSSDHLALSYGWSTRPRTLRSSAGRRVVGGTRDDPFRQSHGLLMLPRNLERDVFAGRRPKSYSSTTRALTIGSLTCVEERRGADRRGRCSAVAAHRARSADRRSAGRATDPGRPTLCSIQR